MTSPRGIYEPPPARGECPSGKVQYATRKQARRDARRLRGDNLAVYPCPTCEWFHLGHRPQRVRNGDIDKAAWLNEIGGSRG